MVNDDEVTIIDDVDGCTTDELNNPNVTDPPPQEEIPASKTSRRPRLTRNRKPIVVEAEADSMFLCDLPDCGKRFPRIANLEAHQLLHKGARPCKCTVQGCTAAYTRSQHLARHINVSHTRRAGAFECKEAGCVAAFATNESLLQHFRRVHYGNKAGESDFKTRCHVCNEVFPSISKLTQHKSADHNFRCQVCGRRFHLESKLKIHEARHQPVETKRSKPTECKLCELKLANWEDLVKHRKTAGHVVKQTIAWTCCGHTFNDQGNFNQHAKTHEVQRDVFRCTYVEGCDRFYYFLKNLKQHIKIAHQREEYQPPKCSICDREFCSKQRLETHIKTIHAPGYVPRKSRKSPEPESRDDLIKKLSGKQKLSGRELLQVKKPDGGYGKRRKVKIRDMDEKPVDGYGKRGKVKIRDIDINDLVGRVEEDTLAEDLPKVS